jgi:hypothetical protein
VNSSLHELPRASLLGNSTAFFKGWK